MSKLKKYIRVGMLGAMILGVGVMAGCRGDFAADSDKAADVSVKTYYVATRGTFKPFTYMDDKDRLTGYDIEILQEVEKRNPDIKFAFKTMSIESAFVALESKQIDLIANQMTRNPDREKKYGFTNEINNYTSTKISVKGDRNDIQSVDDLRGKTVIVTATSEAARLLKKYNETAEPKINLTYTDKGSAESFNILATGRADAGIDYEVAVKEGKETLGLDIKSVGKVVLSMPTYYILRKDEDAAGLGERMDKTIKEMRADGTLKKLSLQYLGADYTVQPQ